ncbi:unnamed protein product, partial [Discosporangium mesarthrocarpum]
VRAGPRGFQQHQVCLWGSVTVCVWSFVGVVRKGVHLSVSGIRGKAKCLCPVRAIPSLRFHSYGVRGRNRDAWLRPYCRLEAQDVRKLGTYPLEADISSSQSSFPYTFLNLFTN